MIKPVETLKPGQSSPFKFNSWPYLVALLALLRFTAVTAEPLKLLDLNFSTLPGDNLQVQLTLSGPAFSPRVFQTDNPSRIALDLPGVANGLDKKQYPVNVDIVESIQAIAGADRTRVVINLTESIPFNTRVEGNNIYVFLNKGRVWSSAEPSRLRQSASRARPTPLAADYPSGNGILNVDFRRGEKGVGRILVTLANPKMIADIHEQGRKVIASFPNANLPSGLARRLDVMDFATPVQYIDSTEDGNGAKLIITPAIEEYDYSSYQSESLLTIEFRPLTKFEKEETKKKGFAFGGEKLSLNFQDIPVRSVLQILGDFTNLNIVASDTVQGNVTLRLNDVPWDQALDLVLKAKNLGKRQEGNIIQILPLDELNKQNKDELEQQKVVEDLEPLKTEIIQINYTNAEDVKKVLVATTEKSSQVAGQMGIGGSSAITSTTSLDVSQSILSARGNVTVDQRTNQLVVKDTGKNIEKIRDLIKKIDIAVRQVLIEARIVIANNDFSRELGSRFAVNRTLAITGRPISATDTATPSVPDNGFFASGSTLTDLGAASAAGSGGVIGFTLLKVGDYLLDLELSAAQREGRGEVLSNPRLLTADQTKAIIKQGTQLPYQSNVVAGGGAVTQIQFKDALLELDVTPHITPDDNIRMELMVKKDVPGILVGANFAIDKREVNTTAQVANGDTVVLGGVYEQDKQNTTDKVPFFGDLPGVGFLFRRTLVKDNKKELLIFITPKIVKQSAGNIETR